jgi:hypothetical protein
MRLSTARSRIFLVVAVLSLLQLPQLGTAQEPAATESVSDAPCAECSDCRNPWNFRVIPYGWIPGFHGDVSLKNTTVPVDVSIGKMFDLFTDHLNAAAIGQVEASNGTFGFIFNGIYADISVGKQVNRLDFSSGFSMAILDGTLTYQVNGLPELLYLPTGSQFEFLAGARYYSLDAGLTVTGPRGRFSRTAKAESDWADPIIGGRLRVPLYPNLTGQVRGDFGGFGIGDASQITWNIEATLEYQLTRHISLMAGYRWLDIDRNSQSQDQNFGWNMTLSGPIVGLAIDF